jgi:amino acid transporter
VTTDQGGSQGGLRANAIGLGGDIEAGGSGGATLPSWSDFSLSSNIGGIHGLANAGVTCAVLYAGWEAVSVVGEEPTKPRQNPGRAMIGSVAFQRRRAAGISGPEDEPQRVPDASGIADA